MIDPKKPLKDSDKAQRGHPAGSLLTWLLRGHSFIYHRLKWMLSDDYTLCIVIKAEQNDGSYADMLIPTNGNLARIVEAAEQSPILCADNTNEECQTTNVDLEPELR